MKTRNVLLAIVLSLTLAIAARAETADVDGVKQLTPNQKRNIARLNHDLPNDIIDQAGDSRAVADLRGQLRQNLKAYQQAVRQFGSGTPEARQTAHEVVETEQALHKQFVKEEAIPAVASR